MELNKIYQGDCQEVMKDIPDKSINLIVIDPPYNIGKDKRWDKWKTVSAYVEFMGNVFKECERVLKDNGSFYFFHNDFLQIVELQNWLNKNSKFIFKSLITWNKTNFKRYAWKNRNPEKCMDRNWFPNIEYCLYYTFQDETGLTTVMLDVNNFPTMRRYFKGLQEYINLNKKQILEKIGQKADHCFRWNSSQWDLPTKETYQELINNFNISKWEGFKEYESLRQEYESLRQEYESLRQEYESIRYTFNLGVVQENISCIWESKESNSGKLHPTQKPNDIIEKIIKTSSNEGDIVLDCFIGSGTTAVAAKKLGRNFIGIELNEEYIQIANKRLEG